VLSRVWLIVGVRGGWAPARPYEAHPHPGGSHASAGRARFKVASQQRPPTSPETGSAQESGILARTRQRTHLETRGVARTLCLEKPVVQQEERESGMRLGANENFGRANFGAPGSWLLWKSRTENVAPIFSFGAPHDLLSGGVKRSRFRRCRCRRSEGPFTSAT
jgi:hypothetical protein